MDSPTSLNITSNKGGLGGYGSLGTSNSHSGNQESFPSLTSTSTTHTTVTEESPVSLRCASAAGVITSPPTLAAAGDTQYSNAEIRVMADAVAHGRKSGELPPTQSSPLDAKVTVEDYALLSKLRFARGDPAVPPPEEYTRLRIETSQRIRDRDAGLGDSESREAATDRTADYHRVMGQKKRYYDLVREVAKRKGVESQGADMERLMEEVMEAVEKGIGTTASDLDSTACVFDAVARSLGGTARTLNTAASNFDITAFTLSSTASTLENTLGVVAAQISTLNSQILALTNALQSHHTAPASPTSHTAPGRQNHTPGAPLEDSVRKGIEHAICEVLHGVQASTSHPSASPGLQDGSYSGSTLWEGDSLSDVSSDSGTKVKKRSRWASEDKTARRAGKYMRIVINKILG